MVEPTSDLENIPVEHRHNPRLRRHSWTRRTIQAARRWDLLSPKISQALAHLSGAGPHQWFIEICFVGVHPKIAFLTSDALRAVRISGL